VDSGLGSSPIRIPQSAFHNPPMHYFEYRAGELFCEDVSLDRIATEVGTPVYIYSRRTLERHVRVFDEAFKAADHLICYAVKANSNTHILRHFSNWGTGFDIVSGGELFRVLKAGGDPQKVIFSGVGKTSEEVRLALESNILFFNVESHGEVDLIREVARACGKRARVSVRTNPNVDPKTHPYISTGTKNHKFGVALTEARSLYESILGMPEMEIVGVACHIGSQITEIEPFREALASIREFVIALRSSGIRLRYLDFGGGLGISYKGEEPPSPAAYAAAVIEGTKDLGLTLVLEPGRVIVGNAGVLLTRVLLKKDQGEKHFVIVDAGMNDLIRPALYGSHHQLWPVRSSDKSEVADVVGPICESADFLAKDREVPVVGRGDLVAVMSAGAYGFSLSSNYNSRPRVAEVLVNDNQYSVIRRRETYEDLIRQEI
jgi:diaminopimelate decarboxylase